MLSSHGDLGSEEQGCALGVEEIQACGESRCRKVLHRGSGFCGKTLRGVGGSWSAWYPGGEGVSDNLDISESRLRNLGFFFPQWAIGSHRRSSSKE
jgi:hypothetical protein